jgi:hypothetical protein
MSHCGIPGQHILLALSIHKKPPYRQKNGSLK